MRTFRELEAKKKLQQLINEVVIAHHQDEEKDTTIPSSAADQPSSPKVSGEWAIIYALAWTVVVAQVIYGGGKVALMLA